MTYGAKRSVTVILILFTAAYFLDFLSIPLFMAIAFVGILLFVAGFLTKNRSGVGSALATGFIAGVLTALLSYAFFRLAANRGESDLEYLFYTLLSYSPALLLGLPLMTALVSLVLDRIRFI